MDYNRKNWNDEHKIFREKLKKEETFSKAIKIYMNLHTKVHETCCLASGFLG